MKKVLLLSGSQRKESLNQRLLANLAKRIEPQVTVDMVQHGEINLPLFDQDLELNPEIQKNVFNLHSRIASSEALIVACPEYNGLITPYLKNTIDWVSRLQYLNSSCSNAFLDKPVLLVSVSTGWSGGAVGLPSARTLLGYVGCHVLGGSISIPTVSQYVKDSGFSFSADYENLIKFHLERFLRVAGAK